MREKPGPSFFVERRASPPAWTGETPVPPSSVFLSWLHLPASQVSAVPAERLRGQVRGVFAIRQALGAAEGIKQQRLLVRAGTLLDDQVCALAGREAAQVR